MQPNSTLTLLQQQQIESLGRKIHSLQSLLESSENNNSDHETLIRVATQRAEYKIESIMEKIYCSKDVKVEERVYESLSECLVEVSESIDYEREELERSLKNRSEEANGSSLAIEGPLQLENNSMVGRESEVEDVISEITRTWSDEREVVAIAGMGGIGKTTFARRVYNDPVIEVHFEVRAWATMSKVYCIRNMLLELLRCIKGLGCEGSDNNDNDNDDDLAVKLKRKLQRRRYLIVIDDIWSTDAWDDINQWFPDYKGSHILLTTRCRNVACYAAPGKSPHQLSLLNRKESWKLLCEKIFWKKEQQLSSEFLEIGKRIAYNCQGLPLTIIIVAGLLSKSNNALDRWKQVERNVKTALFEDGYRQCEKVLALSYRYLPQHLKACFLYFGVFPEDKEVPAKQLIKLWVAEGFLREDADKSLVDVGEECLHELIDRNLIFISEHTFTGKAKRCKIHDLLHELCLREARNESFLFVVDNNSCVPEECQRMVIRSVSEIDVRNSYRYHDQKKTRSFICSGESISFSYLGNLDMIFNNFKMIRVLDLYNISVGTRPITELVHLRYLSLTTVYREDLFLSNLPNLQTLVVHYINYGKSTERYVIHLEIWSTPLLRNLHSKRSSLISPPSMSNGKTKLAALEHLRSITGVDPAWCKKEILAMMPNLKKLGIMNCRVLDLWDDLPCLSEVESIESLKIRFKDSWQLFALPNRSLRYIDQSIFPPALKKLTLINTFLSWEDMDFVGTLPCLEVLKLRRHTYRSYEWEPAIGGFSQLKFLLLDDIRFNNWKATDEHFPVLERLYISRCSNLKEIPKEFAYIPTLQVIELVGCSFGVETSAKRIPQEQEECLGSTMTIVRASETIWPPPPLWSTNPDWNP